MAWLCLLWQVMCKDYVKEKTELIQAVFNERKHSDLPKINQVILISHAINILHFIANFLIFFDRFHKECYLKG